jgi:3-methyladenine DNA glycosylase AlkD
MHPYLIPVKKMFRKYADPVKAAGAKAYMRNQFEFFGFQTPVRRMLTKEIFGQGLPTVDQLPGIVKDAWLLPQREFQYFGIELVARLKKDWTPDMIPMIEEMITEKSWWDSVDNIASLITGPYFLKFPAHLKPVTQKWNRSDNFWLQRSSILFQKAYREKTNTALLSKYILHCAGSKEFFIQKAIGWSLREYAKTDREWVLQFVQKHPLAALSKREALKHFS